MDSIKYFKFNRTIAYIKVQKVVKFLAIFSLKNIRQNCDKLPNMWHIARSGHTDKPKPKVTAKCSAKKLRKNAAVTMFEHP